ncbi:MAG TPA: DUF4097 family beta strand repeat-containing protein [Candidatus Sulfotelmatobacter sp.]|nr:DUF4097 family beta strand repeat-containing protein [Candidatus Sulfotelmatobacter sp.]
MNPMVLAVVMSVAMGAHSDTTINVTQGARLTLENYAGSIDVQTWTKNAVRVEVDHNRHSELTLDRDGDDIQIELESDRGVSGSADYRLTVPAWIALKLSGVYCDISAKGLKGKLEAETVQGDVEVTGGDGYVSLTSVQGHVTVAGASGKLELSSVNEGVDVTNVKGDLSVESVNGAITMSKVQLNSLEASTVNGTITYDGTFAKTGRYEMSTHNGNVYVAIPADASLNIEVATYGGSFESTFTLPKTTDEKHHKRFSLQLGSGGADLDLESFQGSILLHRPGEKVGESDEDNPKNGHEKIKVKSKPDKGSDEGSSDDDDDGN